MSDGILNGMVLEDMQCLVAVDTAGEGWILARSEHISMHDILEELTASDNGFNDSWNKGLSVGIYLLTIKPWSFQNWDDWDTGIDVIKVEPLWIAGQSLPDIRSTLALIQRTPSLAEAQKLAQAAIDQTL